MPPRLPDRYRLEIRLGRDDDLEEWLATDLVLDRPVLIRLLGPESSPRRREGFLERVRAAAAVTHTHLTAVYAADLLEDGAYLVGEWPGGVRLADRLQGGETMPPSEFLPNAAGLAGALAQLHERGVVHGAVDETAVFYTYAHPAKLGAFGRLPRYDDPAGDLVALGEVLERAITGGTPGVAPPSQVTDGVPSSVDEGLEAARRGHIGAAELASVLQGAPSAPLPAPRPSWSWRWLLPATVLLGLAVAVTSLGLILREPEPGHPFLFPVDPPPTTTPPQQTTTTAGPRATADPEEPVVRGVLAHDPFGDGREHDDEVEAVVDGDPATAWRTERYFDPMHLQKPGVGLTFELEGTPGTIEFLATSGTAFSIFWAPELPEDFEGWERIGSGTTGSGPTRRQLVSRRDGLWLLWFTELPAREDGYYTHVAEVRFLP